MHQKQNNKPNGWVKNDPMAHHYFITKMPMLLPLTSSISGGATRDSGLSKLKCGVLYPSVRGIAWKLLRLDFIGLLAWLDTEVSAEFSELRTDPSMMLLLKCQNEIMQSLL